MRPYCLHVKDPTMPRGLTVNEKVNERDRLGPEKALRWSKARLDRGLGDSPFCLPDPGEQKSLILNRDRQSVFADGYGMAGKRFWFYGRMGRGDRG